MPVITLRDYVRDDLGAGIGNIRVRAYAVQLDDSIAPSHEAETFTAAGDGEWQLSVDTANSPSGQYAVEIYNSTTGETRWRMPDVGLQVEYLVGPDGEAPIADQSITQAKIALGAVGTGQLADDAVTVAKVADLTVDDANTPASDTGTLQQILDGIVNRIKAITGEDDWYDAPDTTIAALASGQGVTVSATAPSSPSTGDVWINDSAGGSDYNQVAFWNGAAWERGQGAEGLIVDSLAPTLDITPSTVQEVLDSFAYQLGAIIGETSWYNTPNTDLATLAAGGGGSSTSIDLPNSDTGYLYDSDGGSLSLSSGYVEVPSLSLPAAASGVYMVWGQLSVSASGASTSQASVYVTFAADGATVTEFEVLETVAVGEYRMIPIFGVLTSPGTISLKARVTSQSATVSTDHAALMALRIS